MPEMQRNKRGTIDKRQICVIAVSLVVAIVLAVVGIVLLANGTASEPDSRVIRLGVEASEDTNNGVMLQYTFECNESGVYYIHMDNATLLSVSSKNYPGPISSREVSSSDYAKAFIVYLNSGYKYEISIYPTGGATKVKIMRGE